MGLSASQARLLTITARKSDCEFQSMTLSHQKIALSRDMERVSQEYQNALNNTKLVYDYYGTLTSDMALSYGLLMTPSIYNDYFPKLVTDNKNRVILNSAYAAAARAAGIPIEGLTGTPSSDVRNRFIEALADNNIITPGAAATIESIPYSNVIGLGSTVSVSTETTDVSYDELLDLLAAKAMNSADYGVQFGVEWSDGNNMQGDWRLDGQRFYQCDSSGNKVEGFWKLSDGQSPSLTIGDLLSNDTNYTLGYDSKLNEFAVDGAYALQVDICDGNAQSAAILDWITDAFASVLGGIDANDLALQAAYNAVYDLIYPNNALADILESNHSIGDGDGGDSLMKSVGTEVGSTKNKERFEESILPYADDYLGMVYYKNKKQKGFHKRSNDGSTVAINLNNLVDVFLSAYVEFIKGVENVDYNYGKGSKNSNRLYDPDTDDFMFTIVSDTDAQTAGDEFLYAGFYDSLFNQICINGWTENNNIDDNSYMQELMKNGMAFISSISNDGFYYQSNYATDPYISEVADDEAIARAEAKYNTEKAKIQSKEDTIDLKMKNLDTEISTLTTEYDTTKSVISKAIERSIKRYDA